jgi:hypothetical protein
LRRLGKEMLRKKFRKSFPYDSSSQEFCGKEERSLEERKISAE